MKSIFCIFSLLFVLNVSAEEGLVNMFNGKDLTGWENPYDWGKITLEGDEIHFTTDKKKFFLVTNQEV